MRFSFANVKGCDFSVPDIRWTDGATGDLSSSLDSKCKLQFQDLTPPRIVAAGYNQSVVQGDPFTLDCHIAATKSISFKILLNLFKNV